MERERFPRLSAADVDAALAEAKLAVAESKAAKDAAEASAEYQKAQKAFLSGETLTPVQRELRDHHEACLARLDSARKLLCSIVCDRTRTGVELTTNELVAAQVETNGQGARNILTPKAKAAEIVPTAATDDEPGNGNGARQAGQGGVAAEHQVRRLRELELTHNSTTGRVLQGRCSICRKRKTSFYCSCTSPSAFEVPTGASKRKRGGVVFLCVDGSCPVVHRANVMAATSEGSKTHPPALLPLLGPRPAPVPTRPTVGNSSK